MKDESKIKAQLAAELKILRRRVAELEKIESHCLQMEERLKRELAERKQAEGKLKQDERKIRHLASAYVRAQEEERQWIALEVHDRLVQTLTAAFHQLQAFKSMPQAEPDSIVREVATDAFNLVKDAINETRNIMKELYPETLAKFGLHPLIREELQHLEEAQGFDKCFRINDWLCLP